jgi:hypothetical protein
LAEQIHAKANAASGRKARVMVLSFFSSAAYAPQRVEKCSIKGREFERH